VTGQEPVARPVVLLPALHEALDRAALAAIAGDHGDSSTMELYLKAAHSAGVIAFGGDSRGFAALNVVLAAIRDEAALLAALSPASRAGARNG
jgi:hypothetical protein